MKEKCFTLKTTKGAARLFTLFLCLILLFSFGARWIASSGGTVKISKVAIDSRGALIDGDLYYPVGTSDTDKLPAIITAHGGGVEKGVTKGLAEELARRGFVVLNVNAYGVAMSEQPVSDDGGQGAAGYNNQLSPCGIFDSLTFLRTLKFVDQSRIGLTGHSMGSRRTGFASVLDCGYYSFNDLMINVLYETFGQTFTAEEINMDADTLAAERLNADQLAYYENIRAQYSENYEHMVRALCLFGSNANYVGAIAPVQVAGHEVLRNCKVNMGIVDGKFDYSYRDYYKSDIAKQSWHTGTDDIVLGSWYVIDDATASSEIIGTLDEVDVLKSEALQTAIAERNVRMFTLTKETHSKNFFSNETTAEIVRFFEQTLCYNGGELGDASAKPIAYDDIIFMWRELLNLLAMLAMVGMLIAFAGMMLATKFFASIVAKKAKKTAKPYDPKRFCLFAAIGIALQFIAIYLANGVFVPGLPNIPLLPFFPSWWLTFILIAILGAGSLIMLVIFYAVDKKDNNLAALGFKMKVVDVLKAVLLGAILLALGYFTLRVVVDLFNQDFRFWMAVFTEMKIEYWAYVWRYTICMLPFFLLIGASTNYSVREDIPEWKDTLITVIVNSVGIYLCCAVNYMMLIGADVLWSSFISTYGMLIIVPITVYITRKLYKMTNSIWLGALINAYLIAWSICSSVGLNCNVYNAQTWFTNFFAL